MDSWPNKGKLLRTAQHCDFSWLQLVLLPLLVFLLTACGEGGNATSTTPTSNNVPTDLAENLAALHSTPLPRPAALEFRVVNTAGVKCAVLPQDVTPTWETPTKGTFVVFDDNKDGKELCYLSFKDGAAETVRVTVKNADGTDFPGGGLVTLDLKDTYNTIPDPVTPNPPTPPNRSPVANAGADQIVNEGALVTLDGSASADSDGSIASYAWVQTAGTAATLSSASVAKPTFTAPDVAADETLTFELTVKDDKGATAKDSVAISVKNIASPGAAVSGKVLDEAISGATVNVYAQDGTTLLGGATTNADGSYSVSLPASDTSSFYIASMSGGSLNEQAFLGEMRAICIASVAMSSCHITPYTTLLVGLAGQYSGDFPSRLAQASAQVLANLGVGSDPFVREAAGTAVTDVNLPAWRQALANGASLGDWVASVQADLTDGYLDTVPTPALFLQAVARPATPVTESNYTIDKTVVTPVDQAGQNSPTDTLSLPEGTAVKRTLYSMNTGEQGDSVTSKDYLSDIAYVETQDFSTITGQADDTVQRIVYQSFNVGKWKGKLDAKTTILSRIFMVEPTLLLLPNAEKERVAGILVQQDEFAQAVDLHEKSITGSLDQSPELLDDLINNVAQVGVEQLDNAQIGSSGIALQAKVSAVNPVSAATVPKAAARGSVAAKAATSSEPFQIFQGMWMEYDAVTEKLKVCSRSSIWYGLQSSSNFLKEGLDAWTSTSLIAPKVGFMTKEDFNYLSSCKPAGYWFDGVKTEMDLASIDPNLSNDGSDVNVVFYRNNPNNGLDAPQIMNTLTILQVVLETAGASSKLFESFKPNAITSTLKKVFAKASAFKKENEDKAKVLSALFDISTLFAEFDCVEDQDCIKGVVNVSTFKTDLEELFKIGFSVGDPLEYKQDEYVAAMKEVMSTIAKIISGKKVKVPESLYVFLRPVLTSELLLRPMAEAAGVSMTQMESYELARDLFKRDLSAKKKYWLLLGKATIKGFSAKKLLTSISAAKTTLNLFKSFDGFSKSVEKMPFDEIMSVIFVNAVEQSNVLIADSAFNLVKNLTPAKWFDLVMAGNKAGALAYDWMTDPSLVKLSMKKLGNTLDISHTIPPEMPAIRYLKMPYKKTQGFYYAIPRMIHQKTPSNQQMQQSELIENNVGPAYNITSVLSLLGANNKENDDNNNFLVMSGFRASLENQTAFLNDDKGTINSLIDSQGIRMSWHVKRFDSFAESDKGILRNERTEANAFNGKMNYTWEKPLENTILWFTDSIKWTDERNPAQKAKLGDNIDDYQVIDFTEFYNNEMGGNRKQGEEREYPLVHQTPGIYSDYTDISFKSGQSEVTYANTLNMYVLPDFLKQQTALQSEAAIYKGVLGSELQLTFNGASNWSEVAPNGLSMIMSYMVDSKMRWSEPVDINSLPTSGTSLKAYSLPKNVNPDTISLYLYNDILSAYAKRSGTGISKTIGFANSYRKNNAETPLIYLEVGKMKESSKSELTPVDKDGDNIPDIWDAFPTDKRYQFDSDDDGMADEWEEEYGLNPFNADDANSDPDNDGLPNVDEFKHDAKPNDADSDDDGMPDAWEVEYGFEPAVPEDALSDMDGDGISNLDEYKNGTDPLEADTLNAPQNFKATPGDGNVTLSWDAVTNAAGYTVCHATESIANFDNCTSYANGMLEDMNGAGLALSGLVNGTTYYFRVIAGDSNGNKSTAGDELFAIPKKVAGAVVKLNDTGITACGDYAFGGSNNHNNNLSCSLLVDTDGDSVPVGQDGTSGRDATHRNNSDGYAGFSFTKIGANGEELPSSATVWSCVKDNVTGLLWEVKTNDQGLHNQNDTFVWYEPNGNRNGGFSGYQKSSDHDASKGNATCYGYVTGDPSTYCNTKAYVERVNQTGWCGATDWRIPVREELRSLVNLARNNPTIDAGYFPDISSWPQNFWSSSPIAVNKNQAWKVDFGLGNTGMYNGDSEYKYQAYRVRLVRGNSGN